MSNISRNFAREIISSQSGSIYMYNNLTVTFSDKKKQLHYILVREQMGRVRACVLRVCVPAVRATAPPAVARAHAPCTPAPIRCVCVLTSSPLFAPQTPCPNHYNTTTSSQKQTFYLLMLLDPIPSSTCLNSPSLGTF